MAIGIPKRGMPRGVPGGIGFDPRPDPPAAIFVRHAMAAAAGVAVEERVRAAARARGRARPAERRAASNPVPAV